MLPASPTSQSVSTLVIRLGMGEKTVRVGMSSLRRACKQVSEQVQVEEVWPEEC